ncbi:putative oxidoreductase [Cellulophaga algicola DSM 14237]|uniref:Oxidoreductase n=1 Tax=Cellulophaga algicola (strain DSM 14237 / IC166 / ACAM 630) TaxID=688270 RepID=E6X705_CELAD|nr:hypothetical protein [Cellulophaga algicola]ADV47454.1 putative oxidoreductase [Cellulophaga algicola DSM 14237]
MKHVYFALLLLLLWSCNEEKPSRLFTSVAIESIYEDSLNIRALEIIDHTLAFSANKGFVGTVDLNSGKVFGTNIQYDSIHPEFRSIAHTATDVFVLSAGNPALLYKTGDNGKFELVYKEEDESVFYDAMTFWNDKEGIAIGDSMEGCLSIIVTRDGGLTWKKQECSALPKGIVGEGAFAASNTNIKVIGTKTWVATTHGRIYYSDDKANTWTVIPTPVLHAEATQGIYSLDFYNDKIGFAIGGDYTKPEVTKKNKAVTVDGGNTWALVADKAAPGYKSCVQFIPNSKGKGLVAVGFTGISYSNDTGATWTKLSDEGFFTLRFKNDSVAYAAGKGRVSELIFK